MTLSPRLTVSVCRAPTCVGKNSAGAKAKQLAEFLAANRLEDYLGGLQKLGYDDIELLCHLEVEELDELITDLQMKKGHARTLKRIISQRKEKEQQDA